jgi:hypothetical protein
MRRVQIQLTDEQVEALERQASASGEPLSRQVRRAVEAWIANADRKARVRRAQEAIGGFHSGLGDLAERHDAYLEPDER